MVTKVASIVVILTAIEEETKELTIRFAISTNASNASNERMLIIILTFEALESRRSDTDLSSLF